MSSQVPRVLALALALSLVACAGKSPGGRSGQDGSSTSGSGMTLDAPDDPACEDALACADDCAAEMACGDTDEACWEGCDASCEVAAACPADDPSDSSDPGDPTGDSAACEAAFQCADECGTAMACADDDQACWTQCDTSCHLEEACADGSTQPPPDDGGPAACEDAWACSDACGAQRGCGEYDDACWGQCDSTCHLEEACAGLAF